MTRQYKSTMVEFIEELEKLPQTPQIGFMIEEAKAGEYHDYKNKKYICGKLEASCKLRALGHVDLARRVEDGEFDEQADEEDKAMMRKELSENSTGFDMTKLHKLFGL